MNFAKGFVVKELSPYKELLTTVVPEQGLVAAATSCFVFSPVLLRMNFIAKVTKFKCQNL